MYWPTCSGTKTSRILSKLLSIHPDRPQTRKISQIVETLENGGIIIYPTDTVYGLGCDIFNSKAVERICQLKRLDPKKARLSFICENISQVSGFSRPFDNTVFRLLKKNLPGPFTFVLNSNNKVPKLFKNKKKTIGIRIPDHDIPRMIVQQLGRPILTTSLRSDDEEEEYHHDPQEFYEAYRKRVDVVIDAGIGKKVPSTIVDCTSGLPEVVRMGAGLLVVN